MCFVLLMNNVTIMDYRKSEIRNVLNRLIVYFQQMEEVPSDDEMIGLWNRIQNTLSEKKKKKRRFYLFASVAAAASVLLCVWIGINYFPNSKMDLSIVAKNMLMQEINTDEIQLVVSPDKMIKLEDNSTVAYSKSGNVKINQDKIVAVEEEYYNQFVVPTGKFGRLILSDGSDVFVNSNTRVIYPKKFRGSKREIFVEGEIYINVIKKKNIPFVVKTDRFDVQVLGTAFNVKAYKNMDNEGEVVLLRGVVNVRTCAGVEAKLVPNTKATLLAGTEIKTTKVDAENYIWWTKGILPLNNGKLSDLLKELSRYYGVQIVCEKSIEDIKIAGKIDVACGIEIALRNIASVGGFIYHKQGNIYMLQVSENEK